MMKKVAFFVEGQTERIFIEKLIEEYFSYPNFDIESRQLIGENIKTIRSRRKTDDAYFYFQILDVHNDGKVLSAIRERASRLFSQDFLEIIGIRDLYPGKREDKEKIIKSIETEIKKLDNHQAIHFILAIMEIEAWFLCDNSLFERIHPVLKSKYILKKLGININEPDTEKYDHPAYIINSILNLINKKYRKKEKDAYKITSKLDYIKMICEASIKNRNKSFSTFINLFEAMSKQ